MIYTDFCTKKKLKLHLLMVVISVFILSSLFHPSVNASLGTFKQNDCVPIITSLNTSSVIISVLSTPQPNSTIILRNITMEKYGYSFNYTFCNTSKLGVYTYAYCDAEGNCQYSNDFEITGNGKPNASGGVIVLFIIIFLILVGITCFISIYTIGHLIALDFDIIDLAIDWGIFFIIITLFFLETFYLGNTGIESYLLWFISIGGIILVLVPIIALILSMTIGNLNNKQVRVRVPRKFGGRL